MEKRDTRQNKKRELSVPKPKNKEKIAFNTRIPIPVYKFEEKRNQWQAIDLDQPQNRTKEVINASSLKVLTWNILFDFHHAELIFTHERVPVIVKILKDSDADMIGLQEITKPFLEILLKEDWIRANYYVSDIPEGSKTLEPYGQVLLTRVHPRSLFVYHFSDFKRFIMAEFSFPENRKASVAVVHLTSDKSGDPKKKVLLHFLYKH